MRTLRASLLDEPPQRVMAIAEAWDIPLEAASPAEMAEALSAAMRESDIGGAPAAMRVREELPADALAALAQLLSSNGRMPSAAFERRFGEIRPMGPGRLERERPWRNPANVAETLWYRGFIFRAFDRAARDPAEWFYVPVELREALSAPAQAAAPGPSTPSASPGPGSSAAAGGGIDSQLLDDIATLLIHIQTEEARVRRDGEWTREARVAAGRWLRDADGVADGRPGGRFAFLAGLVTAMGWARAQDGRLRLNAQPVANWLQLPAGRQRDALFNAWRDDPVWNDLERVDGLAFEMTHAWSNNPPDERRAALRALESAAERVAPGGWPGLLRAAQASGPGLPASAAAVIDAVKTEAPEFMRPDGRYDTWHIRDTRSGEFLNGFEHWDQIEGAYLRALVGGPLRWLEADRLGEPSTAPPEPALRLTAGAEVAVLPGARFARFQLARIAQPVGPREDGGWTFALTPRSLSAAARQGITERRAIEFLEKGAGAPVSATLARAIGRAIERGSEARAETGVLLRAREAAILDALLRLDAGRRGLIERLSPTAALIRPADVAAIAAASAEMGFLIDIDG